jgi:predicted DNA-binding transcriptional regulator AlpA
LTPEQVADLFQISPHTLRNLRSQGGGPRFVKLGGHTVRYRLRDVMDWAEVQSRDVTKSGG